MGLPTVELVLDPKYARDLYAGGVFITGCALAITEECELVVRGAAGEMRLGARVVFVDPTGRGAGLELVGFGPELRQRIADLAVPRTPTPIPAPAPAPAPAPPPQVEIRPELDPDPEPELVPTRVTARPREPEADAEPATTISTAASLGEPTVIDDELGSFEVDLGDDGPTGASAPVAEDASDTAHVFSAVPDLPAEPPPPARPRLQAAPTPPDDDLELAPEPIRDVSPGSALDIPMDPRLEELQTYEIEPELDLAPPAMPRQPTVGDIAPLPFDPEATQPLSLDEMDDNDALPSESEGELPQPPPMEGELPAGASAEEVMKHAPRLHERMRGLTLVQQLKFAHTGELQERILLERIYGKAVWEALLRNPRITAQEVARIARMGALPRPLLEQIVGNGAWLQVPEVRRALLTHPRLATDQVIRVLRLLPKHELKLATTQTAYPMQVREQARRILRGV